MKFYSYPEKELWPSLTSRPRISNKELIPIVEKILQRVKREGDTALFQLTEEIEKVKLQTLQVSDDELIEGVRNTPAALKEAIQRAKSNIEKFHQSQTTSAEPVETTTGVKCWRKTVPIEKIGCYIPGGTAPLFSTILMLAVPGNIAGCKEIILCTPPNKEGKIHPAILYTASLCNIKNIYKIGGAQAIGAMAYGTSTVPICYKIFGPGNQYVTSAKQLVNADGIAIDMPAGPSEILVIADETANPKFLASDLLSQAEHGADSQVILVSDNENIIKETLTEVKLQLDALPRKTTASDALLNSRAILFKTKEETFEFSNEYAPEHLIIASQNALEDANKITNAGSVFLGHYTPESAGDYASGTNHVLPTYGYAKAYSGVSLDSFVKKITFQHITEQGLINIGPTIEKMASEEKLQAHKNAVTIRLNCLKN